MRLSSTLKILVGLATLTPFVVLLIPLAAIVAISLGAWDALQTTLSAWAPSLPVESIGWNAALTLAALLMALHLILVIFYTVHILTNHNTPSIIRFGFVLALLVFPFITMAAYYFVYVLPTTPPNWAKLPNRGLA